LTDKQKLIPVKRSYDEAILHACNQKNVSRREQIKTLYIIDSMNLKPISIMTEDGTEDNLLGNATSVNVLASCEQISCFDIVPDDIQREKDECS
jgi:hypothetical protein